MNESERDTSRAFAAGKVVIDGRNPSADCASILVTTEHAIASVLLMLMNRDPRKAAEMLNEGLVQGIERRLALFASKSASNTGGHYG